ncbi:MAG: DUF3800 domain-containing protein [Tenuifilaceae bacterium]|nr:DUF3800 domain-containing protein [Tenuifilaceae bacterium]
MSKTFNIYCDESCHLENDHKRFMLLGCVSVAYNQVKRHNERINNLKKKHNFYGEIKWTGVSSSQYMFYKELLEYFFDTDIRFRAVVVDKTRVMNDRFAQDFDTFYYKMYYQLLIHRKNSEYSYNVYLDIKDTLSSTKVNKLKDILNTKYGVFRNVQNIHSKESLMMQLTDFLMGAISYELNNDKKRVVAKQHIIDRIKQHSKQTLSSSTNYTEKKLNLFFIELK